MVAGLVCTQRRSYNRGDSHMVVLGLKFRDGLFWEVVLYQRCFLCGEYIMGRLRHWSL